MELRGPEPLTSSMPWWPGRRKGRAAGVGVLGRAGGTNSVQPGSPSVCSRFEWRRGDWKATLVRAAGLLRRVISTSLVELGQANLAR